MIHFEIPPDNSSGYFPEKGWFMKVKLLVCATLILVLDIGSFAQSRPLWRGQSPGPYSVGFKVLWTHDYSRSWQPEVDYEGKRLPVDGARPIRISVWYPAKKQSQAASMLYSAYLHVSLPDQSFTEVSKLIEDYDFKSVRGYFKSQAMFDALLKTPTAAFLNAPAVAGSFPLVVYSLGQNDHTLENIVLWEFLASHGYVIATIPHLGTSPRRFQLLVHDPVFYEAQVRDLEFVIQQMRNLPNVDAEKLALVGHSMGGIYALLTAIRNSKVDAVIGLDPSFVSTQPSYYYKYWEAPWYDPARLKAPLMVMYKSEENHRWDIVDNLKYSDRYLLHFPKLGHGDFNVYPMITSEVPQGEQVDQETQKLRDNETAVFGHKIILRYVLNFLDASLKNDKQAQGVLQSQLDDIPAGFIKREFRAGLRAPDEEEFYSIIREQGLEKAIGVYRAMKAKYPQETIIREAVLRRIGNEAGYYGNPALGIEVFRLNVEANPQSASAYNSLAEAYLDSGNKELAIKYYEKSLELNPNDLNVKEKLSKLR